MLNFFEHKAHAGGVKNWFKWGHEVQWPYCLNGQLYSCSSYIPATQDVIKR